MARAERRVRVGRNAAGTGGGSKDPYFAGPVVQGNVTDELGAALVTAATTTSAMSAESAERLIHCAGLKTIIAVTEVKRPDKSLSLRKTELAALKLGSATGRRSMTVRPHPREEVAQQSLYSATR
jgi:hypothetical protein